jgi:hypothetical protein
MGLAKTHAHTLCRQARMLRYWQWVGMQRAHPNQRIAMRIQFNVDVILEKKEERQGRLYQMLPKLAKHITLLKCPAAAQSAGHQQASG